MITLDKQQCKQCSLCITRFHGYCITEKDGYPVFNHAICNLCQKCAAICPSRAIMVNNTPPVKIEKRNHVKPEDLYALFKQRRSTKLFKEKELPGVLGVLYLGYSAENIMNIPQGYELNIKWNTGTGARKKLRFIKLDILDLGIGTGNLTEKFLEAFPHSTVSCLLTSVFFFHPLYKKNPFFLTILP